MEKESVVKRSVAELAGRFTCQMPIPTGPDGDKPVRRRPPRTLQLPVSNDAGQSQDQQKGEGTSHPPRKQRNSALIEKLQANLVLSPTALLPSPMSPGAAKPPPLSFSPNSPCSPASPTAALKPSQAEAPASFEKPVEGTVLLSINKGRARHSIKRRPPSRRHRKSSSEEVEAEEEKTGLPVSEGTAPDDKQEDVFEKQKVEEKNAESLSSTSEEQKDQNQRASPFSELQPTTEGENQSKVCEEISVCEEIPLCVEKEEKAEKNEKKPDEPQLSDSTSESTEHEEPLKDPATEPQRESDQETEVKEVQEKKEEEDSQTEESKGSEQ